jgi:predicted CoA-binding protein
MNDPYGLDRHRVSKDRGLDAFFSPKSVALIGATEKKGHVGRAILWNLISSPFGGTVYPVNPKRTAVTWHQGVSVHFCGSRPG